MARTFRGTYTASFAVIIVDMPVLHVLTSDDGRIRAKYITVVTLVAEAAIEAAPGLTEGQVGGYLQINLIKRGPANFGGKAWLSYPGFIIEIIRIDFSVLDKTITAASARPSQICLHGKRRSVSNHARLKPGFNLIDSFFEIGIQHHRCLLAGGYGLCDIFCFIGEIPTKDYRRTVFQQ